LVDYARAMAKAFRELQALNNADLAGKSGAQ
jgi:hypothetical protein